MNLLKQLTILSMVMVTTACALTEAKSNNPNHMVQYTSGPAGFNTNTFFYVGKNEVVAFDAQFTAELAEEAIKELRKVTDKPIRWVVVTHPNPDKFNGSSVFQKYGAQIISSESTAQSIPVTHKFKKSYFVGAKMFTEENYPKEARIDVTFKKEKILTLSDGEVVILKELSEPGISSTQTVAFVPSVDALIVGDLVHYRTHAWLEGGIVAGSPKPTINGWIKDLNEIRRLYPNALIYGGRGDVAPASVTIPEQIQYLKTALQLTSSYAKELKLKKAQPDYQELQKRFEQEFPAYELGYMIQYGSYGLLNTQLNK